MPKKPSVPRGSSGASRSLKRGAIGTIPDDFSILTAGMGRTVKLVPSKSPGPLSGKLLARANRLRAYATIACFPVRLPSVTFHGYVYVHNHGKKPLLVTILDSEDPRELVISIS